VHLVLEYSSIKLLDIDSPSSEHLTACRNGPSYYSDDDW